MTDIYKSFAQLLWIVSLFAFLAIKVGGTTLAAWSWLWLLLPQVPFLGLFVQWLGL